MTVAEKEFDILHPQSLRIHLIFVSGTGKWFSGHANWYQRVAREGFVVIYSIERTAEFTTAKGCTTAPQRTRSDLRAMSRSVVDTVTLSSRALVLRPRQQCLLQQL